MEAVIRKLTEDGNWQGWVAANSAQSAKDGCVSAAPKSGCVS